jgi:hypothetical protein
MIHVQPSIDRFKLLFSFPLAIVDFLVLAAILQALCLIFRVDKINLDAFKPRR